ncbi:Zn-dependent hydrolase [Enterovirga sp.]|uniref:Zn-dependent hydrolase n=1 Tax=Enterovirga sp. TaxID=2026350 RepID=UPI002C181656|nr:Zn-dependent hydrolase [Enterovirga sp.]HMO27822.1 Zn-dependent hydrolase [Enterovirga sp.]
MSDSEIQVAISSDQIRASVADSRAVAASLFEQVVVKLEGKEGIFRDTYGPGESHGHRVVAEHARQAGLEIATDAAANTYMTLPGRDRSARRVIIGSHLDSVPNGGNFDGAAGVVAGLTSLAALKKLGVTPPCDITVMGVRAEESVWFQVSYIGSRSALGVLPPEALDSPRIDTGRRLSDHIADCGGDPERLRKGEAALDRMQLRAFVELHIEQAPTLVERGQPIAIGTGIPGNFRYPNARVHGRYGHVGTPRRYRQDAAMAASDLAMFLDRLWAAHEDRGIPMAVTFGRFHTDAAAHGLTTVPGEFEFSLDVRAYDAEILGRLEDEMLGAIARIERGRNVRFSLGQRASAPVGPMDADIIDDFNRGAAALAIPARTLHSPASHDAAAFAAAGVPVGMIFVRNRNGSHNPAEAMELDDFMEGTALITWWLANCLN